MDKWKRNRKRHGPGGIACPCCNSYHCHPRKSKPLERRLIRRKLKRDLLKE